METLRTTFQAGTTLPVAFRLRQLKQLRRAIQAHESEISEALHQDLGKPPLEAYVTEIGFVLEELSYAIQHLAEWVEPTSASVSITLFHAEARIEPRPLGLVLIIGPWNYPFQLILSPLIGAIAAGNCAVVKPSEHAPATSALIRMLLEGALDKGTIKVFEGGVEATQQLLAMKWDSIFFTGSTAVGRLVARAAADQLTPVTLELGGKSPCILDDSCDLTLAVRRTLWGKFMNAGQTCVAPDVVFVPRSRMDAFVAQCKEQLHAFYGSDAALSDDYGRIINDSHFSRLEKLLGHGERILLGGKRSRETRYFEPTLVTDVPTDSPLQHEEIFGPILPILPYESLDEVVQWIRARPKPLAFYLFSRDQRIQERLLNQVEFGGGCINDTLTHLSSPELPFGGVGASGMGAYHGKHSFDTFTHRRSLLIKSPHLDLPLRYPPYSKGSLRLIQKVMG